MRLVSTGPGNTSSVKHMNNESYFHANAYKRLNVSQVPGPSSIHREERAAEFAVSLLTPSATTFANLNFSGEGCSVSKMNVIINEDDIMLMNVSCS